jgi:putative flippase GtrA
MQMTFQSIFQRFARPLRFGVVGLSGIVVNSAILWVLVRELHLAVTLGSVLATELYALAPADRQPAGCGRCDRLELCGE